MKFLTTYIAVLLALLLFPDNSFSRDLGSIKRSGKIYVAMTKDDMANINYPLAVEFAKYLNVEMIVVEITWEEAFMINGSIPSDLETNPSQIYNPDIFKKADIICSTFTILDWRKKIFDFAETLNSAELLLVDKKSPPIKDFSMLAGKSIAFMGATSFEENLNRINKSLNGAIKLVPTKTSEESKSLLRSGKVFGIILDADEALNYNAESGQKYSISLPISPMTKTAWTVEKGNNLKKEVQDFFKTIESNGVLNSIFNNKFGISYSSYVEKINKNVQREKVHRDLDEILASRKLVVALRERNFIYREGGEKQFMNALAEEFADYLGVSLEFVVTPYLSKYWETENGEFVRDSSYTPDWFNYFDVACEVFAPLDWREKKINFVPVYPSEYSVIARKDKSIKSIEDLRGLKCVTNKGSVYEDVLNQNKLTNLYYAPVNDFLEDVHSGKADYTILYNAFYELSNYPELESKISLGNVDVCWGLRKDQPKLKAELEKFMAKSQKGGLIKILVKAMQGKSLQSPEAFIHSYYESFQTGQLPYVLYGAEDGLPQEDIFTIFQDNKGYMWFGTNSGAVRYNGREMKSIGTLQGLGDNSVRAINQDSSGIIYIATSKGIAVFDHDTIVDQLFPGSSFRSIFVDKFNSKWFIGNDGIYILSQYGSQRHLNKEFPLLPTSIYSIEEDQRNGDKYIASSDGVYYYSAESNQIFRLTRDDSYSLFIDSNDSIWISTKKGLFMGNLQDLKSGNFDNKAKNLNRILNFPNNIIKNISTNKYGSVWLVTDSKIMQVLSTDQPAIVYEQEIGLKNNKIMSFLVDQEDNIWVGFSGGLQRLSNKKGLRNFFPNTINSYIYSILQDSENRLWCASNNGVYYYDNKLVNFTPNLIDHRQKFVMAVLPNHNLLFASSEGMYEFNSKSLQMVRSRKFEQLLLSLENIFISSKGEIYLLTGINGVIYYFKDFHSPFIAVKDKRSSNIFQLSEKDGKVIGGNSNGLIELDEGVIKSIARIDCNVWSLYAENNTLWVGTECGLGYIINDDYSNIQFIPIDNNTVIKAIYPAKNKNYLWLGTNRGFAYFNINSREAEFFVDSKDGLSGDEITPSGLFLDSNDLLWVGTYHGLSNFNIRAKASISYSPSCYIERVLLNGKKIEAEPGQTFRHNENNFVFEISALSFSDEESIEYEFYLRGTGNNYSSYHKGKEYKAYYNNLPPGKYEFIYKAKGKNNIWGYAQKYNFSISTAWYNTWIFRFFMLLIIVSSGWAFYKIRIRSIEQQKQKLEQLVKERTHELEEANAEIEAQRDHATSQRDQIASQKKEITDSIYYAEKIQRSLLPPASILKIILPEHFILFRPRDIVSGDFYWAVEKNNKIYLTAADCTGHGVPGAFMSMLGISFLNEIIARTDDPGPDEILNMLRKYIVKALKQVGESGENKDGMDMVMVVFDKNQKTLSFAGANNPLYLVRNNELQEIKGDKMPVGIHEKMNPFKVHHFDIHRGDTFYMFSDGYADQFGGPKAKKFMAANFKNLIMTIQTKSMREQGKILNDTFEVWKGDIEQIDDIVVIGLRF
ncbi:MAG: transporter substrate-binding domain-containing protein [Bacteroidales bacterium]|nr:transporter substrate-binding domain-containing protein [Bacteroidales bacterium]